MFYIEPFSFFSLLMFNFYFSVALPSSFFRCIYFHNLTLNYQRICNFVVVGLGDATQMCDGECLLMLFVLSSEMYANEWLCGYVRWQIFFLTSNKNVKRRTKIKYRMFLNRITCLRWPLGQIQSEWNEIVYLNNL